MEYCPVAEYFVKESTAWNIKQEKPRNSLPAKFREIQLIVMVLP